MKKMMLVLFVSLLSINAFSQYVTFRKAIGNEQDDFAASVRETSDYGFIVAGTTGSVENTNSDVYLFKLDSLGNHLWSNHFGTSYGTENGKKVVETTDNGFVVVGFTNSFGNGGYDIYVIRTDSIGNEIWSKTFGGSDWDFGHDVLILPNGNYGIVGYTYSFGNGSKDAYFIEIDDAGNELNSKTFGGASEEVANGIALTVDNKLLICGETTVNGNLDGYLIKAELNGDTVWTKIVGGDSTDYFSDIIATNDNNYLAVGSTSSFGLTSKNFYYVKIDNSGTLVYERNDGGSGDEEAREVAENTSGNCSMIGYSTSVGAGGKAIQLFQVSSGGWWVTSPQYGSALEDNGFSIDYTHDNGYIIAGITNGYNAGNYDALIIKTDSVGNTGTSGDVINITDNLVGIYEATVNENKFYVYYNESTITIKSDNELISKTSLLSSSGQLISEHLLSLPSTEFSFDINFVSTGLYFIKTDFKNNYSKTIKVLINK